MSSLIIDRTRFVYGPTYLPKDQPTSAKQYAPTSSKVGIISDCVGYTELSVSECLGLKDFDFWF